MKLVKNVEKIRQVHFMKLTYNGEKQIFDYKIKNYLISVDYYYSKYKEIAQLHGGYDAKI